MDRTTKILLAVIATNLTLATAERAFKWVTTPANAQGIVNVHVTGGRLDYETDTTGGPTLKVCTNC